MANFFSVLGVQPLVGRTFTAEEDRTGAPVVVVSYGLWQRRFGGDRQAIGSPMIMNGSARTIIGVLPAEFVATRAMTSMVYGVGASDTATFRGGVRGADSGRADRVRLPAFRASRLDPMEVLRQ